MDEQKEKAFPPPPNYCSPGVSLQQAQAFAGTSHALLSFLHRLDAEGTLLEERNAYISLLQNYLDMLRSDL